LSIVPGLGANEQVYFINPKLGFNVSDKISLGGGFIYMNYPENQEYEIFDTLTIPVVDNGLQIGDTTILYTIDWENDLYRRNGGIVFGVGTYGDKENNLTLGLGYVYYKNEFLKHPVFMLGGMVRTSRRTALVTENWIVTVPQKHLWEDLTPGNYTSAIIMYGVRFFGERMSVDLAFFQFPGEMGFGNELFFPGIPYLDFVVKF